MEITRSSILVVDGDPTTGSFLRQALAEEYALHMVADTRSALGRLSGQAVSCVLLDAALHGADALAFLRSLRVHDNRTPVVLLGGAERDIVPLRDRVDECLPKPLAPGKLRLAVARAIEESRRLDRAWTKGASVCFEDLIGISDGMRRAVEDARRMARSDEPVIVTGETGTGKELLVRAIHDKGGRRSAPFVPVNCADLTPELAGSELFGHERGAFTGAIERRLGKFELADGGTLFLDEVGDLAQEIQGRLLRVLQDKKVTRVGGREARRIDVRVIAATNGDLRKPSDKGPFRLDLYQRLCVVPIHVPPLRERPEDVPVLLEFFRKAVLRAVRSPGGIEGFSDGAMGMLVRYAWPGNVRELEHLVRRLVAMDMRGVVTPEHLPVEIARHARHVRKDDPTSNLSLKHAQDDLASRRIHEVLARTKGNKKAAARVLGIGRTTLIRRLSRMRGAGRCPD